MFLAMEFVQLGDLEKNVARSGKIPVSEARDIAAQILFGLEIMHTMKFAHRDLKPQVYTFASVCCFKYIDFGTTEHYGRQWSTSLVDKARRLWSQ